MDKNMGNVYFGVKKTKKVYLDETKEQWVEIKKLTEGEMIQYQDAIGGKVKMDRTTNLAEIESKTGTERSELIKLAVCGIDIIINEAGERMTAFDKAKWEDIYLTMDTDKAQLIYDEISIFNGFTKKK
jgi:hypothetical protein